MTTTVKRCFCAAVLAVTLFANVDSVAAQGVAGAAFIVSRLPPGAGYIPGSLAVPPNGLTRGAVLFGGVSLTPRVALQGEVSIPATLQNVRHSSHPSITIDDTTRHRDVIGSALVRLPLVSWCDVVAGAGVDFERTTIVSVTHGGAPGQPRDYTSTYSSSATRAVFTTGVDLPVRISNVFALLPTGRIHAVGRYTPPEPGINRGHSRPRRGTCSDSASAVASSSDKEAARRLAHHLIRIHTLMDIAAAQRPGEPMCSQ